MNRDYYPSNRPDDIETAYKVMLWLQSLAHGDRSKSSVEEVKSMLLATIDTAKN